MEYNYIIRDYMNCDIGTINIIDIKNSHASPLL